MNAPNRFAGEHGAAPQEGPAVSRPDPMIADLARRIFSDHEDAPGLPPAEPMNRALWSALAASGLLSLTASPGLEGLVNAAEVAREAGRTAARVPLVETLTAAWVQACCGWPFEDPAEGPVALAFSHAAPARGAIMAALDLHGVAHVRGAAAVLVIGDARRGAYWTARVEGNRLTSEPAVTDAEGLADAVRTAVAAGSAVVAFEDALRFPLAPESQAGISVETPDAGRLWNAWLSNDPATRAAWESSPPQPLYLKPPHITASKRPPLVP